MPHLPWTAALARDRWTTVIAVLMVALYGAMLVMRPGGEGFGRGWNLIAFWLYASPTALVLAAVSAWRAAKASGTHRWVATVVSCLCWVFPVVALVVMRAKA